MIGDTLRKEREKQKLSIHDIEQGTSIRSVYIDALEKGEYDKLPGEVYAKGFIKNYGNFLNLNGEELVRQFIMEISTVAADPEENTAESLKFKDSIAATNVGEKYQSKISTEKTETESGYRKYLAAAGVVIAILIGGIFYNFSGSEENIAQSENPPIQITEIQENKQDTQTSQISVTETQSQIEIPESVTQSPPPVNEVNLQVAFSDDCWTQVIVDGTLFYEGMVSAGETKDWKGNNSVNVLLGNAGAAQFVMNGQTLGAIGGYGEVVERNFTR